jgi:predicted aspartyl protease
MNIDIGDWKMRYIIFTTVIFFVFNIFSYDLHPQEVDLVKLKKQEEERKKKAKKSKYVLTNDNLDKIDIPEKPHAVSKTGKTSKGSGQTNVSPNNYSNSGMGEKQKKEYWQQKKRNLVSKINRVEAYINKMQAEFNRLNLNLHPSDIGGMKMLGRLRRQIEILKQLLENLKKELKELEVNARKAGVLPGWLRDI